MISMRTFSELSVDLHAALTHLLQPRNDWVQAELIATFSTIRAAVDGSIFDARNGRYWVKFRYKSTIYTCEADKLKGKHFDIRNCQMVPWSKDAPQKAAEMLKATIRNTLPDEAILDDPET